MTADIIKFPKLKAKPPLTVAASDLAEACAAGSARGLTELAAECAAARESGNPSPISAIAAVAAVFEN